MPNDNKGSLEEGGITVSKVPVRAWMIVSEAKPPNIILFFPLNAYILKTLRQAGCSGNWWLTSPEH